MLMKLGVFCNFSAFSCGFDCFRGGGWGKPRLAKTCLRNWCGACTADPPAFFGGKLSGDWINFLEHKPISRSHKFSVNKNEAGSPRLTLSSSFIKWTYITCILLSTFVITFFWIDKYFPLFPSASVEDWIPLESSWKAWLGTLLSGRARKKIQLG